MSASPGNPGGQLVENVKAIGAILGAWLSIFTIASQFVAQPTTVLVVSVVAAIIASVLVVRYRWADITVVIFTWLVLIVIVLLAFVIWPRTMTVEGIIRDTAGNPVSHQEIVFFDRSGRRYETTTDAEGYYQFPDVPTGRYKIRVRSNEVEGETKGLLVRVAQQNIIVLESLATTSLTVTPPPIVSQTSTPTGTSISTSVLATDTSTPVPALTVPATQVPTLGKVSADIYAHQSGFTLEDAEILKQQLEENGIPSRILIHRDPTPSDAIFIGALVGAKEARMAISSVPYEIKYIFRPDYPAEEGGDPSGLLIGIGYVSTHYKVFRGSLSEPVEVSAEDLKYLTEPGLSNAKFQQRLREITQF